MGWIIIGFVVLAVIGGMSRESTRLKADQAVIKMARAMEAGTTPQVTQVQNPAKKSGSRALLIMWASVLLFVVIWLATSAPHTDQPNAGAATPVVAAESSPPGSARKPAPPTASKAKDEITAVQDHCYKAYMGSTSDEAFMHATPVVRKKVVDCMGYYFDHNKHYPSENQLAVYSAAQDRDYLQHLSPKAKRRHELEALGEAICHGDETCIERGVETNEAIDDLEAKLNSDSRE